MYRILTEDKNREAVYGILDSIVGSYTVTPAIGAWKGTRENALAIDLVDVADYKVREIARRIKTANNQEWVLILDIPCTAQFI